METFITTKVTPWALRMVRVIAAITGEKQFEVLERLLAKELTRISPKLKPAKIARKVKK